MKNLFHFSRDKQNKPLSVYKAVGFSLIAFLCLLFLPVKTSAYAESGDNVRMDVELVGTTFVTPEMFGAAGDGKVDDTAAIQKAVDSGYPVLLSPKVYLTNSTITISGKASITDTGSTISYTGYDYAIRFTQINNNCDVSFGTIKALNGSGIEFYCSSRQERCQYINLSFNVIEAHDCCILFNRDGDGDTLTNGWLNEIRIHDGRFQAGKYGVYANAKGYNGINNIKFTNVTFEGVTVGAHMAYGCRGWSFMNLRIAEMNKDGQLIFETEGSMIGLVIMTTDRFRIERTNFSEKTQGSLIAPIMGYNHDNKEIVAGNIGEIINGKLYIYDKSIASLEHFIAITDYTDLNTLIYPGNYCCKGNGTAQKLGNSPTKSAFTMIVYYANGTPDFICQEIRPAFINTVYKRVYSANDNSFTAWEKTSSEDDLKELQNEVEELRILLQELLEK